MTEPKRPGRPPLVAGDTTTPVTVRMPTKMFDRACSVATERREGVRDIIRRAVARELDKPA